MKGKNERKIGDFVCNSGKEREREIEKDIDRLIMIKVKMKIEMDRKRCHENNLRRVRRLEIMDCY